MKRLLVERTLRRALLGIALGSLILGLVAWAAGLIELANGIWAAGIAPVVAGLLVSMLRDIMTGRLGVDAIALVSMSTALALGENLAGVVVALMYAGGNALEDFAVARAENDLKSLVERAPRFAHRREGSSICDIGIEQIAIGDSVMVRAGEVVPVDGIIVDRSAEIDESALTGEPVPVTRRPGETAKSGTVNAGATFEISVSATAGESTYAGIVRLVHAARTARAPFIRLADRYALLLLPISVAVAGGAWLLSGDPVRGLAVLVAATPCPLILAAPVAFVAGVAQAARLGILIKGGRPFEALARTHTVMFDKTGTLTVGGARLVAIETAPDQSPDSVLQMAGSLEQASHHVVAAAIVQAALQKGLDLSVPSRVRETMGSGLEGLVEGQTVKVGSSQLIHGSHEIDEWAVRALRRATWRSALCAFVAVDGRTIGALLLGDELRRDTPRAVRALRSAGVRRIVMVTGDRADAAETIGSALDLDGVLADRGPSDKVDAVRTEQRLHPTVMVGDGINDAPALAAANVGIALGASGASASSEAADVVILVNRLDRVSDAVLIAKRARRIAVQSVVSGMALSGFAMFFAAIGWLSPVASALTQEAIDVAVILNALRALTPGRQFGRATMPTETAEALRHDHERMEVELNRLREIADALDDAKGAFASRLISEANEIIDRAIVKHERDDETKVYVNISRYLSDAYGLSAMGRAHREIMHQARLLEQIERGLTPEAADRYLIRDAQRVIEAIDSLVRIHNAQEEDIYEYAISQTD